MIMFWAFFQVSLRYRRWRYSGVDWGIIRTNLSEEVQHAGTSHYSPHSPLSQHWTVSARLRNNEEVWRSNGKWWHDDKYTVSDCWLSLQFYIVTGGISSPLHVPLATTEILKKEGGTSWQTAASLPFDRSAAFSGVSLPNGHFMVSGDDYSFSPLIMKDPYSGKECCWDHPCWRVWLWSWWRQVDQSGAARQGPQWTWHEPRAQGDCWLLCPIT